MGKSRNNKKNNGSRLSGLKIQEKFSDLHPETKKTAVGVIFLALSAISALSYFRLAGWFGDVFYNLFDLLLGYGFFLIPILFLILALIFLFSRRPNLYFSTIFGASIFLISVLALMEVFGSNTKEFGGYVGFIIAYPLSGFFGFWGSLVLLFAGILTSIAVVFDIHFKKLFGLEKEKNNLKVKKMPVDESEDEKDKSFLQKIEPAVLSKFSQKNKQNEKTKISEPVYKMLRQKFKWVMPPFNLLVKGSDKPEAGDIKAYAGLIQKTLADFGIPVEMGEVSIGPTVTQYTLKPAQGIKLSRITALNNDLSLALAAHPIRIEAPIPGKSLVGIEIPNKSIALVRVRTLLERDEFLKNPAPLSFPLGIDVSGQSIYVDLATMPHLLVCGSTGSGKSASIHNILTAMLYKNSPQILRMLLIDPKRVELIHYSDIPHLISDVIINSKDAVLALRFISKEMERRYEILSRCRARDIISYNSQIKKEESFMPYIVVVIDELADLMTTYQREVETSIVRLAQMARAVGIHLIISTQRPSVEVITGLIKANITSRVAFTVASQIDSRTILDVSGAEKLLGRGDMLYISSTNPKPKRIQGSFITEDEVKKVTDYLRSLEIQVKEDIQEDLSDFLAKSTIETEGRFNGGAGLGDVPAEREDELYEEAKQIVLEAGKASASYLQRRLKIGYARAARLLDLMESEGLISGAEGAKPRMVLKNSLNDSQLITDDE